MLSYLLGDVFSQSDTAKTMAEISRIDPQFNKDSFLKECEFEIIPSVLEVSYSEHGPCFGQLYEMLPGGWSLENANTRRVWFL